MAPSTVSDVHAELPHQKLSRYIRAFASWHGVNANDGNPHAFYNTRVEHVERGTTGWDLIAKELVVTSANTTRATWYKRVRSSSAVIRGCSSLSASPEL